MEQEGDILGIRHKAKERLELVDGYHVREWVQLVLPWGAELAPLPCRLQPPSPPCIALKPRHICDAQASVEAGDRHRHAHARAGSSTLSPCEPGAESIECKKRAYVRL